MKQPDAPLMNEHRQRSFFRCSAHGKSLKFHHLNCKLYNANLSLVQRSGCPLTSQLKVTISWYIKGKVTHLAILYKPYKAYIATAAKFTSATVNKCCC